MKILIFKTKGFNQELKNQGFKVPELKYLELKTEGKRPRVRRFLG